MWYDKKVSTEPRLIKIDRNGSKHFVVDACPKCAGKGWIPGYEHVEGGICFMCDGSGYHPHKFIERTKEYEEKLYQKRLERGRKKSSEVNAKFFKREGMNENGEAWVILGNTFEIKDQLKEAGAKWNPIMGWHFDKQPESYLTVKISIEQIGYKNELYVWSYGTQDVAIDEVKKLKDAAAPKTESRYIAEVGEVVDTEVKLVSEHSFETHFTFYGETKYIYKFADAEGNTIVWKTGCQDFEVGKSYKIKGKVKELSEYKGDKQTVLTRCKVVAVA